MGTQANSADPDQTPHDAASDQGLHCLLTVFFFLEPNKPNIEHLIPLTSSKGTLPVYKGWKSSTRLQWVNIKFVDYHFLINRFYQEITSGG